MATDPAAPSRTKKEALDDLRFADAVLKAAKEILNTTLLGHGLDEMVEQDIAEAIHDVNVAREKYCRAFREALKY